jgi:hypothetical protein
VTAPAKPGIIYEIGRLAVEHFTNMERWRGGFSPLLTATLQRSGEIMIGPPGLPKFGRRVFSFAGPKPIGSRQHLHAWKWVTGLYLAGVLAHFSHHMVDLPDGSNPSMEALTSAPVSLVWPADLIGTLIDG